mmetsp:Transcript_39060/g.71125  ORF Transcript_39060/g.71125 Transcript_39060/m.71125 type:complete len:180 (-) Transcript_39060:155-694(-)
MSRSDSDRDAVLERVKKAWWALQSAAEPLNSDHEIVLEAVRQHGQALRWAAESCRGDRKIVLEAVKQDWQALEFATDELLEDSSFALDAKKWFLIFKITLMSGRSCCIPVNSSDCYVMSLYESTETIVRRCCDRLGLLYRGSEELLHGCNVVPRTALLHELPSIRGKGEVNEYQLLVPT